MRDGVFWIVLIELIGIISFAVNAMIVAHAKKLSPMGIFAVAAVAAFGGGTLRDIMLGPSAYPFFWLKHPLYVVVVFTIAMAYALTGWFRNLIARRVAVIKDAAEVIALASLGEIGTLKAYTLLSASAHPGWVGVAQLIILSACLGAATSAAGSVLRDVLLNETPSTLKRGAGMLEPLALGTGLIAIMLHIGLDEQWALAGGFVTIVLLRSLHVWGPKRQA